MNLFILLYSLFIVGLGLFIGKYPHTISGYNTMSKEKKKNVDIKAVGKLYRKGLVILALLTMLFFFLFSGLDLKFIAVCSFIFSFLNFCGWRNFGGSFPSFNHLFILRFARSFFHPLTKLIFLTLFIS